MSKSGGTPGVIWMLGGFVLGVVVTVLYRVGTPVLPKKPVVDTSASAPTTKPAATPATDFTYHDILGGLEIVVPGQIKSEPKVADPSKPATNAVYTLQVGAFRTAPEADKLRAQLALIGIESKIQKSTVDDKDTWYRVRVGPIKDEAQLEKVRARLTENKINAMLVRGSA